MLINGQDSVADVARRLDEDGFVRLEHVLSDAELALVRKDVDSYLDRHGRVDQSLAGGHAGDDFLYRFAPFHLEPVGGVITDGRAIEFFINQLFQFTIFHCRSTRSSFYAEE